MNLPALFRKKKKPTTNIAIYDIPPPAGQKGDAGVKGNTVAIWRPPVNLGPDGRTPLGVSKQLIARYLVATTAAMANTNIGPVTVEWKAQQGRFVLAGFNIHAWNQQVDVVHPIAPISQDLANAWELYHSGMALKVRQIHKGHQRYDQANTLIRRAARRLMQLRDDDTVHFNDAEFLFLTAALGDAVVLSALVPVGDAQPEQVLGTSAKVA